MTRLLHSAIRNTHLMFRRSALPDRVAIYFHELERADLPAFRIAVQRLLDDGYRTVSPGTYADPESQGKLLFLSFDDNFLNWYQALDTLKALGATATFYVNSGVFRDIASAPTIDAYFDRICYHGERITLSTVELQEIDRAGHTIGCHTHTHPMLRNVPRDRWPHEIAHSKAVLENLLGHEIVDFSYPFGMRRHFSEPLRRYCADLGFQTIVTALPGLLYTPLDPLSINRTGWKFSLDLEDNLKNLMIEARFFVQLTGRSAIG